MPGKEHTYPGGQFLLKGGLNFPNGDEGAGGLDRTRKRELVKKKGEKGLPPLSCSNTNGSEEGGVLGEKDRGYWKVPEPKFNTARGGLASPPRKSLW